MSTDTEIYQHSEQAQSENKEIPEKTPIGLLESVWIDHKPTLQEIEDFFHNK